MGASRTQTARSMDRCHHRVRWNCEKTGSVSPLVKFSQESRGVYDLCNAFGRLPIGRNTCRTCVPGLTALGRIPPCRTTNPLFPRLFAFLLASSSLLFFLFNLQRPDALFSLDQSTHSLPLLAAPLTFTFLSVFILTEDFEISLLSHRLYYDLTNDSPALSTYNSLSTSAPQPT